MIWPFSIWTKARKSDDEFDASRVTEAKRIILLMQGKWKHAAIHQPPSNELVMFTRDGEDRFLAKWNEVSAGNDIHNLWWLPIE